MRGGSVEPCGRLATEGQGKLAVFAPTDEAFARTVGGTGTESESGAARSPHAATMS